MYFDMDLADKIPNSVVNVLTAISVIYAISKIYKKVKERKEVKGKYATKQQTRTAIIGELEQQLLVNGELVDKARSEIIELGIHELLEKLQNGQLLCIEVLHAYQAKAVEVTKKLNCITDFILEAEEWARKLDNLPRKGPLHGLPFSVKESVGITGYDCTLGVSKFLNLPESEDAAIVSALRDLGAIPFCKTNVPQTLLSFGCGNPVFGTTKNPHGEDRTPGGSSGGEGSLIGAGGSILGIGSDIGGSARIPAAFCGIASIKPTYGRLSYKGFRGSVPGVIGISGVPGIMARDVETTRFISNLLLENSYLRQYDHNVLPIAWNERLFNTTRKLRIGFYDDDGFFPATPGVKRSVQMARETLEKLGHELVPFRPQNVDNALRTFIRLVSADQGKRTLSLWSSEDLESSLRTFYLALKTPALIKKMITPILNCFASRMVPLFSGSAGHGVRYSNELWEEVLQLKNYREEFISSWKEVNLDLCIGPTYASPAPLIKHIGALYSAGSYTMLYNVLDLPIGIVPVTKENKQDQELLEDYNHRDLFCRLVKKTTKGAMGMPLSVQIIGLPWTEELILRGMSILEAALQN